MGGERVWGGMARPANRLSKLISSLHKKLPAALHQPAQTLAFNSQVLLPRELSALVISTLGVRREQSSAQASGVARGA